jgi:ATP-dependent DNA helicase RecQ
MKRAYAELPDCRRGFLLNYFGEVYDRARCGACDNDLVELQGSRAKTQRRAATGDRADLAVNSRVAHAGWGDGTVQYIARDSVTVLFDRVGYKTFDMALVQERDLLEPIESSTLDVEAV